MSHLYITDLDGTLLNDDTVVSPRSIDILNEAIERGALFSIATARTPATVEVLLEKINLKLPAIVMTGAALWDKNLRRFVEASFIPGELSAFAVDIFREEGLEPFMYCMTDDLLNVYHSGMLSGEEKQFVDARLNLALKKFHLDTPCSRIRNVDNVILVFGMGNYDVLERIAARLAEKGEYSVSFYEDNASTQYYIEVFAKGVSKADAVKRLAAHVGAGEITVYGDNLNDISMMQAATDPVAVANAKPEVLAAASRSIGLNIDDSVALDIISRLS